MGMARLIDKISSTKGLFLSATIMIFLGLNIGIFFGIKDSLIPISIFFASAVFLFLGSVILNSHLKNKASSFLKRYRNDPDLKNSLGEVSVYFRINKPTNEEIAKLYA